MRNAGLEEAQAGIKIAGRNINNLTFPPTIDMFYLKMESEKYVQFSHSVIFDWVCILP